MQVFVYYNNEWGVLEVKGGYVTKDFYILISCSEFYLLEFYPVCIIPEIFAIYIYILCCLNGKQKHGSPWSSISEVSHCILDILI